ncbi:MAG: glycoside hydrolase family protein [Flavobacteriaceae bacterium]|nr:glycoside hydrolase family protein [Flavobacteriaceae bacterium]MCY4215391.1 glycoside hydrolase family protein [Flavobacteriaceae bacterium]MCY4268000.1 glycoside hydrolase family protein [Flavobacteriaceae bacterium]MCY4298881.1 glycoside hydrolase family protein [Flavobacteriaceae bacterium]
MIAPKFYSKQIKRIGIVVFSFMCVLHHGYSQENTDDLDLSKMIQPIDENNILRDENYYNWGSSIVKGKDGKYHLFYAQMPKEHGFRSWLTDGVISRATSDNPSGPYVHQEVVLKGRGPGHWDAHTAHNPRIKYFEGQYYLYYMSTNIDDRELTKDQWYQARFEDIENEFRALVRENQRIGVVVADDIHGPWKRFDAPIVEPAGPIVKITCNPAIAQRPDGGYVMLVRGDKPNQERLVRSQAVAMAPSPIGPWELLPTAAVGNLDSEDPAIWYDENRKRYYGIYHAFGYMGLITSEDGKHWQRAKNYKVLGKTITYKNGKQLDVARLERPFVYVEDGLAKVMTVAVREKDGTTYSLFIPLK